MAERHEEKYLITYREYARLKAAAAAVLTPDSHGLLGGYTVTSLYYDDPMDTALLEKQDGLPLHTKFRLRTYDSSQEIIRLERKVKRGVLTQKHSVPVTKEQLQFLGFPGWDGENFENAAGDLVAQMQAAGVHPAVTVRYRRDAFFFQGTDLRLTFDTNLETLAPDAEALFDPAYPGIPVLDGNTVIMEIKYGSYVPSFLRKLTAVSCKQLSVSKYALCRERIK